MAATGVVEGTFHIPYIPGQGAVADVLVVVDEAALVEEDGEADEEDPGAVEAVTEAVDSSVVPAVAAQEAVVEEPEAEPK